MKVESDHSQGTNFKIIIIVIIIIILFILGIKATYFFL